MGTLRTTVARLNTITKASLAAVMPSQRRHIISFISHLSEMTGITRAISWRYGGSGSILVLHRVVSDYKKTLRNPLYCSVDFLEQLIRYILGEGHHIISMRDLISRIRHPLPNHFVTITFDDGYRDNLEKALPIFRKYSVPMTIYITSGLVKRTLTTSQFSNLLQYLRVEKLVLQSDALDITFLGGRVDLSSLAAKERIFRRLQNPNLLRRQERKELEMLFAQYGISDEQLMNEVALDEAMVKTLASDPLVEIGAHTETHPRLAMIDEVDARAEIQRGREYLESLLDREVRHFAYPSGSCGPREFALVCSLGFATGVTTRYGNVFPEHVDTPAAFPRIALTGDQLSVAEGRFRMSGAGRLVRWPFGARVVTG